MSEASGRTDPVSALINVFNDIQNAIARTFAQDEHTDYAEKGSDRYVHGGVNWDNYDLNALIGMVAPPADPNQVVKVAGEWRSQGGTITQSAEDLTQSLNTLMNYWQGKAADTASSTITQNASWIAAMGQTTSTLADSIEDAGGALRSAQATMPTLPPSTTAAATTASAAAGPMGTATGAVLTGLSSAFAANAADDALKQQAVQTMQRYEQAAVTIDTKTPQFSASASGGSGSADGSTGSASSGVGAIAVGALSGIGAAGLAATAFGLTSPGQNTMPSFADDPAGRWNALTGGGGLGKGGVGGSGLGSGGFGLFGSGSDGAEEQARRGAAATAGVSSEPTGGLAASARGGSIMEEVGGSEGSLVGSPAGGGMAARGGNNSGDGEHRRRIPFEDEPFTTGLRAVPPVIGLNGMV